MRKSVPEQIADAVFALLPVGTATAFGMLERETHSKASSVVAVCRGSQEIIESKKPGDDGSYTSQGRALYERRCVIEWDCHGVGDSERSDFAVAEDLYLATLLAVRNVTHHSEELRDERWLAQDEDEDGFDRHGEVIRFTSVINLAVYDPRGPLVELTATPPIDTTFELNNNEES